MFRMRKRVLLIGCLFLIILGLIIAFYNLFFKDNYVFKVNDVSCNCAVNTLYVYDDKSYKLVDDYGKVLASGVVDYDDSVSYLGEIIKEYPEDELGVNYQVTFKDGTVYNVSISECYELLEYMALIDYDNIFRIEN